MSKFTNPDIPELALHDNITLINNMHAGNIGAFSGSKNAHVRHLMTNLVRRVFASIESYRLGREHALGYVQGDRHSNVTLYFKALMYFESCIGYSWQVADSLIAMASTKNVSVKVFERGDDSSWERINRLNNEGIKHAFDKKRGYPFGRYDQSIDGEAPTSVWLTNKGIGWISGCEDRYPELTYRELADIIEASDKLFYTAQAKAIQKRQRLRNEKTPSRQ